MQLKVRLVITVSAILMISCFDGPPATDLIGRYHFSNVKGDSIIINNDHSYEHKFVYDGKIVTASGTWSYRSFGSEITFENFSFYNDESDDLPPGLWHSTVRVEDGGIRLMYSTDPEVYYLKDQ